MNAEQTFRTIAPIYMRKFMADFNSDTLDAAAAFGNLGHECLGFTKLQEIKPTVAGSKGGYGWAQWTGPRRRAYEAYCEKHNLDPAAPDSNYAFVFVELTTTHKAAITKLKAARTLQDKVKAFELAYEGAGVKNYPERNHWAAIALDALGAAGPSSVQPPVSRPLDTKPLIPKKSWVQALIDFFLDLLPARSRK